MEIDRASKKDVFDAAKVPIIEEMIREKRLRWFGHLIREKADDPAKKILAREKEIDSKWFQQITMDLRTRKLTVSKAEILAFDKSEWRSISSSSCVDVRHPISLGHKTAVYDVFNKNAVPKVCK